MTDIADLIIRLESATEGSRELDALIFRLDPLNEPYYRSPWATDGLGTFYDTSDEEGMNIVYVPACTTSVDAALTLIPEDHNYWIMTPGRDEGKYINAVKVRVISPWSSGGGPHWEAFAPTAPLALCLAALRARQSTPNL